jgi:5'(3')-deoxyribonucleotidase
MKQRIAIDMDEVLADTVTKRLAMYLTEFGEELPLEKLHGFKIYEAVPEAHQAGVRAQLTLAGFFRDIPLMAGAQFVLQELLEKYEVFITTAAMEYPNSFAEKYDWIKEHLPFFPDSHIVFCGDKSVINADYLIDDTPHHFTRFVGQGILFTASHNVHETRYPRVDNWSDVRKRFLGEPLA